MAEFCLECWNKINGNRDKKTKYVLSKDLDLCEGCGEWKHVIVAERSFFDGYMLEYLTLPFEIIYWIICFLWRLLMLLYSIFKYKKPKNKY